MGVRRITLQEYEKADQIKRVAFLRTTREEAKNEADRPEEIFESIWAYFDDDERMTARVRNIDYTMFFDGQKVRMGGISARILSAGGTGQGSCEGNFARCAFGGPQQRRYVFGAQPIFAAVL